MLEHTCEEVSRGLALFPAGEDTHAALCLVWADSHLESAWNRRAHVAVQCEMTRHSCWIKIKNTKKMHSLSSTLVLWSLTAKHFSVGPRSPTHTNTSLSQYVSSVLQTAQQFFIVSVQKKDTQSEGRDKHTQTEGGSRPNTFEEFTKLSVKPLWVCRKQISRTH